MNREHYTLNKGDVTVTYSMLNIRRSVNNAHCFKHDNLPELRELRDI